MAEFIDRKEIVFANKVEGSEEYKEGFLDGAMCVLDAIDGMPTIEAKPVVHAHWENWGSEGTVCSRCYGRVLYECDEHEEKSKFCPHCGAQMDEKEDAQK